MTSNSAVVVVADQQAKGAKRVNLQLISPLALGAALRCALATASQIPGARRARVCVNSLLAWRSGARACTKDENNAPCFSRVVCASDAGDR